MNWYRRFFLSTRGRILSLIRRESRTVDDLADALGLTDNAVRAHLAALERDGFVQQRGARKGSSKPAFVYELAEGAEPLFPKAYGQILNELLAVLDKQLNAEELEELLRATGRHIAARWNRLSGSTYARLEAAVEILNELGGLADLEPLNGGYCIRSNSCPLAAVVPDHPAACHLAETLIAELVGVPVQERCEKGDSPRCRFEVTPI
ncbi:MAG TPA: ArsR family transcriptional regulator [Ktedonobacteraceae bacterium]|nr:ArsR family transcriptional regulator [Ktedonobacteraceae bacterium]